ncbi:MAG: sugar ABC transporter ATP-binding protein [Elusimicrobiota bacterium]
MNKTILELRNISKEFPGVKALDNVNLALCEGELLALVGENGAGKSTLMKILSGVYPHGTYSGEIVIDGKTASFPGTREAEEAGIAIIHQELNLIPGMSVAENIFLGREPVNLPGIIDWNRLFAGAREALGKLKVKIDPHALIGGLTVGQQQMVEIAKALSINARILILDEPTSALTESEVKHLFDIIKELKKNNVSMIYISHKLDEVFSLSDRITVLRDGSSVGTKETSKLSRDEVISMMVGRSIKDMFPKQKTHAGNPLLSVKNLTLKNPEIKDRYILKDVNFEARGGEILGIGGLMGSGRTALAMALFGEFSRWMTGEMVLCGEKYAPASPKDAIEKGLVLVTEDRKLHGLVLGMSVGNNITLSALHKICRANVIDNDKETGIIIRQIDDLKIKTPSHVSQVNNLSGGNQQKVVLGKWLCMRPKVLILDEPTRGIDVGAKVEIYNIMNRLVSEGASIIMISSELPELLGMCDRVLVLHEGEVAGELDRKSATPEKVMHLATGGM